MNNLELLRREMVSRNVAAVIVPSNDTHFSEYVSSHFKCREWLSGFTGSAGTAVVTSAKAALFTDSRYFLQAAEQLAEGFELQKTGLPDSIGITDYIKEHTPSGNVGVDAALYSAAEYAELECGLKPLALADIGDMFAKIWTDRPPLSTNSAFLLDIEYAGKTTTQKLADVKALLKPAAGSVYVITTLEQTAWLLNLRGRDVAYTPVVLAYSVIDWDTDSVTVFVNKNKLSDKISAGFAKERVKVEDYANFTQKLPAIVKGKTAVYHPQQTSRCVEQIIKENAACVIPENTTVPCINAIKAQKNATEIDGFRRAMQCDGAAWIKFWRWMELNVNGGEVTEISAARKLRAYRAEASDFVDESFAPIISFGAHGAIVHYSATPDSNVRITRDNFVLIDTGGQYYCGTTDITRTLHLGTPTPQQKKDYTLVLKGHIALSRAVFPEGTRGAQLDVLARQYLWQEHLLYLHGTGHGVGHFLGVHEGPQGFRLNENPATLKKGMITSCEPGLYRAGEYGIRIENLVLTTDSSTNEFGNFYKFEPLTLCPYDLNCIDAALLTKDEIEFLNNYHTTVYERISLLLNDMDRNFLKKKCGEVVL
jgi:Xaa-Pro aminopeptidase